MVQEEKMSIDERRQYLNRMQQRYRAANRAGKADLLREMVTHTRLHRKNLIRLMGQTLGRKRRARQRGRSYGRDLDQALSVIAEAHDDICAERLQPNLVAMAMCLAGHGELTVTAELLEQLQHISVSTLRRHLRSMGHAETRFRLPRFRPRPRPNALLSDIPIGRIPNDVGELGHFEVDLVHHCGKSSSGLYVSTLQMVDVHAGWTERGAVLGRSYLVMQDAFEFLLERIPFPVREVHSDNDSAFFNYHLLRFWRQRQVHVNLTRSRPYHKNDNRFVEQSNSSLVRAYLGQERLDTVAQTWALNYLYDRMWVYHNFFQPVMRQQRKVVISDPSGGIYRVRRLHDQARTPLSRALDSDETRPHVRERLEAMLATTNPRALRTEIYERLDNLMSLPCATAKHTEDVRLTLRCTPIRRVAQAVAHARTASVDG